MSTVEQKRIEAAFKAYHGVEYNHRTITIRGFSRWAHVAKAFASGAKTALDLYRIDASRAAGCELPIKRFSTARCRTEWTKVFNALSAA